MQEEDNNQQQYQQHLDEDDNRSQDQIDEASEKKRVALFDIDNGENIDELKKVNSQKEFDQQQLNKNPSGDILADESDMSAETNLPGFEKVKERIKNPRKMMKNDFDSLFNTIVAKDKELERLTLAFERMVEEKVVEIEGVTDEQEMNIKQHQHLYEMEKLKTMDQRMRKIYANKMKLLRDETTRTIELRYQGRYLAEILGEIEARFEAQSRKREIILTKLYARLNSKIKIYITQAEGAMKIQARKRIPLSANKDEMLFDGIRDQKIQANWVKTPQPVCIKLMRARQLCDKIPKGEYIIRASILDRLCENKLYYKFIEYGNRVKEGREVDAEKERQELAEKQKVEDAAQKEAKAKRAKQRLLEGISDSESENEESEQQEEAEQNIEEEQRILNKPLFSDDEGSGSENEEISLKRSSKTTKVTFAASTNENTKQKSIKSNSSSIKKNTSFATTKIGFDQAEFDQKYKGIETEKVWIDFGKVNTNVTTFDPDHHREIDFDGHKMYFMMPPSQTLLPSNVIMFELIYLSSKSTTKDIIAAWGAFPLVNGDFQINQGKFKLPLIQGELDFTSNKFKDIEKKYMRNIDEWLCNLYIEVKQIELFDFRKHEEKILFKLTKEQLKKQKSLKNEEGKDDESEEEPDSDESDGFNDHEDIPKEQVFVDDSKINFHEFKYLSSRADDYVPTEQEIRETQMRKLNFIFKEIISDMGISKGNIPAWISTLLICFCVVWLRMIIHYMGQYVFLKIINAPVTDITFKWYKVKLEYAFWNLYQQLGVIVSGTMTNTLAFGFMILTCQISQKYIFCFPRFFCKIIAWFGLATCLDFFFIVIIDFANQDIDGDLLKLYNYYEKSENSGFIGIFLTFVIQFALLIINIFVFYNYIVFVHNDARISDIYLRITGKGRGYYIPDDNEISWNYLKQTYCIGEINNNRIVVNIMKMPNPLGGGAPLQSKIVQIQRFINEKATETDAVFYSTEHGQILDLAFTEMQTFRNTSLFGLISKASDLDVGANQKKILAGNTDQNKPKKTGIGITRRGSDMSSARQSIDKGSDNGRQASFRRGSTRLIEGILKSKLSEKASQKRNSTVQSSKESGAMSNQGTQQRKQSVFFQNAPPIQRP